MEDLLHSNDRMQGGSEHRVARLRHEDRVLKVAGVKALASESLFNYLSDLLLSNYYFDDDLQLMGCYKRNGKVYIVTSQPYVDGDHPTWEELKAGLASQGLTDPSPHSRNGTFIIEDEVTGGVNVIDLHVNNVIRDAKGRFNPIDAHFYFDTREERIDVLHKLGMSFVEGPSGLAVSQLPDYSDGLDSDESSNS